MNPMSFGVHGEHTLINSFAQIAVKASAINYVSSWAHIHHSGPSAEAIESGPALKPAGTQRVYDCSPAGCPRCGRMQHAATTHVDVLCVSLRNIHVICANGTRESHAVPMAAISSGGQVGWTLVEGFIR